MRLQLSVLGAVGSAFIALLACAAADSAAAASVLTYHGSVERTGDFVVPGLTFDKASRLHIDPQFQGTVSGHLYAQPLYWQPSDGTPAMLIAAGEDNVISALDATTGKELWHRTLGPSVPRSALACGNIDPLGVTGTPVIDGQSQALYVDAAVQSTVGMRHMVFALSLKDGSTLPGWPVDVAQALKAQGQTFNARDQNERGALTIVEGRVYVPYGGHFGDCGNYHGWVVGIAVADPHSVSAWSTRARGGGIWAPGGLSFDGVSLFASTGNTFDASTFADGNAAIRLAPDLKPSTAAKDYFAPANWQDLDRRDLDLGGTNPLPLDLATGTATRHLLLALGKDGRGYLLDRDTLGGIGGALVSVTVSTSAIRTSPALINLPNGPMVAFQGPGASCPASSAGGGLTVLKVTLAPTPAMATAWCAGVRGAGSPIVTTTDGQANPIVWILGAEGDNRLHGFRADTGEVVFAGGGAAEAMTGLHHFQTLIATDNRLYVAADGRIYAFTY